MQERPVLAGTTGGLQLYLVDRTPEHLPEVRRVDLDLAWEAARNAALADHGAPSLAIRFAPANLDPVELALTDRSACAWARGVDRGFGLATLYGLALLLRLLALVELATRATWLSDRLLSGKRIEPDAASLAVAARLPLSPDGRFDEAAFRAAILQHGWTR